MANMKDEMSRIVICKQCGWPEYYGEMRWLSGRCECRNCYKCHYEQVNDKLYEWKDLDGPRPSLQELSHQQGGDIFKNVNNGILYAKVRESSDSESVYKNLQDMCTYILVDADMLKFN